MPHNPTCSLCPLSKNTKSICTWGKGNPKAAIFAIGEALGEQEDREGRPFVGPAGKVLDQCLAKAGLKREDIYLSNVCKCRPPANRTPEPIETRACFPYLIEEIQAVSPKVIIALGGTALKVLSGRDSITRARGSFLDPAKGVRLNGAKLLGTYHPAAYLHARNPAMLQGLIDDLTFAARLVREPNRSAGLPPNVVSLLPPGFSAQDLQNALSDLDTSNVLAMDCEWTYMTDRRIAWPWTRGAELYSISLSGFAGAGVQTVAFACPLGPEQHAVLATFIRGKKIVFHNAMADLIWLDKLNLPITLAGDTMILAHLFNETAELKLETLAESWVGVESWKSTDNYHQRRPVSQEAWEELLSYNATDTFSTLLLMQALYKKLQSMPESQRIDITRFYKNLSLASLPLFVRMAVRGMPLSLPKVQAAIIEHEQIVQKYGIELAEITHRRPLEAVDLANSPAQVKQLIKGSFGIEVDTTNSYVMDQLAEQYPLCSIIQNIKHETKILGTYLRPWAELLIEQGDGRLHTVYNVAGAATSRTTAQTEKGATVQLVMREEWMRSLFEAPEGYELDSADQCLATGTLVPTIDGTFPIESVPIGTLVFGVIDGIPVARKVLRQIHVGIRSVYKLTVREENELWKKKGQHDHTTLVTAEHKFMRRDGSYACVFDLKPGDRMMHMLLSQSRNNYPYLRTPGVGKYIHQAVAEAVYGPLPKGRHVHHINHDTTNNHPNNLAILTASEHFKHHANNYWKTASEEDRALHSKHISEGHHRRIDSKGYWNKQPPNLGKHQGETRECVVCKTPFYAEPANTSQRYCSHRCQGRGSQLAAEERYQQQNARCRWCGALIRRVRRTNFCNKDHYSAWRNREKLNHKVVSVEYVGEEEVHCIEVEECHNFMLENGLISSNSQLELRIAAAVANERTLLGLIRSGVDPHRRMAAEISHIPESEVSKEQRQAAKPVNFGFLYHMGPEKFRIQAKRDYGIDFSLEEAESARNAFFRLYPDFQPWYSSCATQFLDGFVRTLFGSYRWNLADESKVCNTLVQSPATELVMRSLIDLDSYYETHPELDAQLVGFVHDSGITLRPVNKREEVAQVTEQIMEHPRLSLLGVENLGIPLEIEIKTGRTWQ